MERARNYRPGGFHPIHIGDTFNHGRYLVINKLGCGSFSTVWLAKDCTTETYVALKVLAANASNWSEDFHSISEELQVLSRLRDAAEGPGKGCIVRLFDDFIHIGPNGEHQCIVTELLGPTLYDVNVEEYSTEVSLQRISKAIIQQLAYATQFLHRNNIVHRDLHSSNVLLTSPELSSFSEEDVTRYCGGVYMDALRHGVDGISEPPHAPLYIVDAVDPLPLLQLCLSSPADVYIKICDFSAASIITDAARPQTVNIPVIYRAPEVVIRKSSVSTMSTEIWALAVLFYFVVTGGGELFKAGFFGQYDDQQLMEDIVLKLGKLPALIWLAWANRAEVFNEDGAPLGKYMEATLLFRYSKEFMDDEEHVLFEEMMRKMLELEPTKRATIDEIVESEWLMKYCNVSSLS